MLLQLPPDTSPHLLRLPRVEIYGFHEVLGLGKEEQEIGENDVGMSCWGKQVAVFSKPEKQQDSVAPQFFRLHCPSLTVPWHGIWSRESHCASLLAPGFDNANQSSSSRRWRSPLKAMSRQARVKGQSVTQRSNLLSLECQLLPKPVFWEGWVEVGREPFAGIIVSHGDRTPILLLLKPAWLASLAQSESLLCSVPTEDVASEGCLLPG